MNVTHHGHVYQAREVAGRVELDPPPFICATCGEGAPTAEQIHHKPTCPLYAAPARKTA